MCVPLRLAFPILPGPVLCLPGFMVGTTPGSFRRRRQVAVFSPPSQRELGAAERIRTSNARRRLRLQRSGVHHLPSVGNLVGAAGLEPAISCSQGMHLATRPHPEYLEGGPGVEPGHIGSQPKALPLSYPPSKLAGAQGFEPRSTGPRPVVLPLDDAPIVTSLTTNSGHPGGWHCLHIHMPAVLNHQVAGVSNPPVRLFQWRVTFVSTPLLIG